MAKKRKGAAAGKLPLDSPNWVSIQEAINHHYKQTGSYRLMAADLNEALQNKVPQKRLRSLERQPNKRTILSTETWRDDLYVSTALFRADSGEHWPTYVERPAVFSRAQGGEQLRGRWIYVWKPDLDRLYPDADPTPSDRADDKPRRRTPGPHPELEWRRKLARELIRRARSGEPMPTGEEAWRFVGGDKTGSPDIRTVQIEMKELLP